MPVRPRHTQRPQRTGLLRHWSLWLGFPLALALVLGYVFVLKSGRWLVVSDPFEKAAWAAVLAGESRESERADAALRLYLDGRIDSLIYSSNRVFKRRWASELLADYLVEEGYPRDKIFEFRQEAYSTLEEARLLIRQFRYQGLDTVVLITVNFHTARSRRIFRELAQGYPHILVHPAETPLFDPEAWWSSREGRKIWLLEWTKTVATWFELLGTPPEVGKAESNALVGGAYGNSAGPAPAESAPVDTASAAPADTAARDTASTAKGDTAVTPGAAAPAGDTGTVRADGASADTGMMDPQAAPVASEEKAAKKEPTAAKPAREADRAPPAKASSSKTSTKASGKAASARDPARKTPEKERKRGSR